MSHQPTDRAPFSHLLPRLVNTFEPLRWLELCYLSALILVLLVVHYMTPTAITAKDYYAEFFGLAFLGLGIPLFVKYRLHKVIPFPVLAFLLLYIGYGTLRVFFSDYVIRSLESWKISLTAMSPILPLCLLLRSPKSGRRILFAFTILVWLLCLYGILQFIAENLHSQRGWGERLDPIRWPWKEAPFLQSILNFLETDPSLFRWQDFPYGFYRRACSTFGNPTYFAGFLVLLPPLYLTLWLSLRPWRRIAIILWLTLFLVGISMATTISRGAVLGTLGGLSMLLLFVGWSPVSLVPRILSRATRIIAISLFVTTAGLLVALLLWVTFTKELPQNKFQSIRIRTITYETTLNLIRNNLLWGVSPGNFTTYFPDYFSPDLLEEYSWSENPEDKIMEHAHCEILEVWADLGLVGVLLYLGFHLSWIIWAFHLWRKAENQPQAWLLAGLVSCVVGGAFENLTSVSLRWMPSAWMYWSFVGAALGIACRLKTETFPPQLPSPMQKVGGGRLSPYLAGMAMITSVLFAGEAQRLSADWAFTMGKGLLSVNNPLSEKYLLHALKLNPQYVMAHYLIGGYYFEKGAYNQAVEHYEQVRQLRGDVAVVTENLATACFRLSVSAPTENERLAALLRAIALFEECLIKHPTFARLEDYLARSYQRLGLERLSQEHRLKAIELYEKWFAWGKSYPRPEYAVDLAKNYYVEKQYEKAFQLLLRAYTWKGSPALYDEILSTLGQVDPAYKNRWQAETRIIDSREVQQKLQ